MTLGASNAERQANLWSAKKRLLALDGGGVRGVVSIAFLERIESLLKARSGKGEAFRLRDHFHLIGGTSTGAIIAAALATGRTVSEIKSLYFDLAARVFRRSWSRVPFLQSRFASRPLAEVLAAEFGDMTLEDPRLRTLLAIITKRVDTGSPWIVSTLPNQRYWNDGPDGKRSGNRHLKLATLVRASTAAPYFFGPEQIPITTDVVGSFIDGGVTPYNTPAIPLLALATIRSFGLRWAVGPSELSIVSIGTGRHRLAIPGGWHPALKFAVDTLRGLVDDCQFTSLMLMQWLGESPAPAWLNNELRDLEGDPLGGRPLFSFQRFDLLLDVDWLKENCGANLNAAAVKRLHALDNLSSMAELYQLAEIVAEKEIRLEASAPA